MLHFPNQLCTKITSSKTTRNVRENGHGSWERSWLVRTIIPPENDSAIPHLDTALPVPLQTPQRSTRKIPDQISTAKVRENDQCKKNDGSKRMCERFSLPAKIQSSPFFSESFSQFFFDEKNEGRNFNHTPWKRSLCVKTFPLRENDDMCCLLGEKVHMVDNARENVHMVEHPCENDGMCVCFVRTIKSDDQDQVSGQPSPFSQSPGRASLDSYRLTQVGLSKKH